jgi:hypothetical protein
VCHSWIREKRSAATFAFQPLTTIDPKISNNKRASFSVKIKKLFRNQLSQADSAKRSLNATDRLKILNGAFEKYIFS